MAVTPSVSPDFWTRTASALVLMPPAVLITLVGGPLFSIAVGIVVCLVFLEWGQIVGPEESRLRDRFAGGCLALCASAAGFGMPTAAYGLAILGLAVFVGPFLFRAFTQRRDTRERAQAAALWSATGVAFGALAALSLVWLRSMEAGLFLVLFLFTIVWVTDTAAYVVGRFFGGPKLWPAVSPAKTWSGSLGGLGFALIAGLLISLGAASPPDFRVVALAGLVSMVAQGGDLLESAFKRWFSVKDSGTLIPGHGGILDRLDGLLVAGMASAAAGVFGTGLLGPLQALAERVGFSGGVL